MLLSISGTKLRRDACDFDISAQRSSQEKIYKTLVEFQKEIILSLSLYLKDQSPSPLKKLIQRIRKLK
jgi:hypothetical protein